MNNLPKEYYINFDTLKVGDKVYHLTQRWLTVEAINQGFVVLSNECSYLKDGRFSETEEIVLYSKNPFELLNNQERVILVRDGENEGWTKRVFIKTLPNGKVVVWSCSESIEYSNDIFEAETWNFWKELEEPKELTPDQRIESLEKEVNELKEKAKGWSTIILGNPIDITWTGNPIKF
jgi:hypothetical protein